MRNTLTLDAKKIKNRLDISFSRIALLIISKLIECFDIYITLLHFNDFPKNIICLITLICLFSLLFIEIYSLEAFLGIFLWSYAYLFLLTWFYGHINLCIIILISFILAALISFSIIIFSNGFYDYKYFFEDDFGRDNKSYFLGIPPSLLIIFAVVPPVIISSLSNTIKLFSVICSLLINSGLIKELFSLLIKNLIHNSRSILIMNSNGVVIKNLLNPNSSTFYFWFNNDKNSPIRVRFIGWCYGSNIKKINRHQWKIPNMNFYNPIIENTNMNFSSPIIENTNSDLKYKAFETVEVFGMSTILSFKLDKDFKKNIYKTTDNICLIYMDSNGFFYTKKLFFDLNQNGADDKADYINCTRKLVFIIKNFISKQYKKYIGN